MAVTVEEPESIREKWGRDMRAARPKSRKGDMRISRKWRNALKAAATKSRKWMQLLEDVKMLQVRKNPIHFVRLSLSDLIPCASRQTD